MRYPDTYYRRTMADAKTRPALAGTLECDTLIVGGGLAGLTTALQLARAGVSVVVLERRASASAHPAAMAGLSAPASPPGARRSPARQGPTMPAPCIACRSRRRFRARDDSHARYRRWHVQPGIMSVLRQDGGDSLKTYADAMRPRL